MAASDPAPTVPTPTGGLQGAAAFSWDGGTWQPAGAAYSSVATPTGVLRGVAPFSWNGGAWTPVGFARPGVPTPTGTLDGVAVYTWSGSAWTPAGGAPDVPTPSGTLQGVAAFYWDGTAWQPSGQAAPEVATPSGVLQGMAMFSLSGGTWSPTVSPAALDLNFVTMTTLDPSIMFTRASIGTYFNGNGVMQTAATNVARLDHNPATLVPLGLLIEESRTNLVLQSNDLSNAAWSQNAIGTIAGNALISPDGILDAAQIVSGGAYGGCYQLNIAVTFNVPQTVSAFFKWISGPATFQFGVAGQNAFGGTGGDRYVQFNGQTGAFIAKSAEVSSYTIISVGNGWLHVSGTFTPTTTSTSGVSAYALASGTTFGAWGMQAENGAFPTSYIPTTSATVTRAADVATIASIPGRNTAAETFAADYMLPTTQETNSRIIGSATTTLAPLFVNASSQAGTTDGVATLTSANAGTMGAVTKAAATWASPNAATICLNGGAIATATTLTAGFAAVTSFKLMGDSAAADQSNGYIRRFRYWPHVLSNVQLQQVTT